jgi:predicted DCC family thiol-disulfide oxidoreductase YuxK
VHAIVLFDADCGFCRWSTNKIRTWDRHGNLSFVALQSSEAADLLQGADPILRLATWHVVEADGTVRSGGSAVSTVLRLLPLGRPLARLADLAPGLTDRAYAAVARNRDRLGRIVGEKACRVDPTSTRM